MMIFDYEYYRRCDLWWPIIVVVVFILPCGISLLKELLSNKMQRSPIQRVLSGILAGLVLLILVGINMRTLWDGGIWLLIEKPEDAISNAGIVEKIEEYGSGRGHKYKTEYDGTKFGCAITIDGQKYFLMTSGELQAGDTVAFSYLPRSTYILEIWETKQ